MTHFPVFICEFFTPTLVLAALIMPWFKTSPGSKLLTAQILLSNLVIGLAVTYGLMMLDNKFKIWPAAGLDYSTHTAFALSFTLILYFLHHWSWFIVLGVYGAFMNYLGYHSWLDMISTVFAWGILALPCALLLNRKLASIRPTLLASDAPQVAQSGQN